MATLEKIRTRGGIFIAVIIGIALLSFIISPESLQQASTMFSSKYDAGEIAGKSISYQDYQQRVDYQIALAEINMGGRSAINEQVTDQIRERVWQEYIKEYVLYKEFEKAGISVSDDELADLINGSNPSPVITQIFTNPETGQLDRGRILQVIQNLDANPNMKAQWLAIEEQVKDNQLYTKLSTLLLKSSLVNSLEVNDAVARNSQDITFSYIVKPYMVIDTVSQVSTSELKKYYNEHKKLYEQTRSRGVQYISFAIKPSADDYRLALENIQKTEPDFITTSVADLGLFVNRNSEKVFDDIYYNRGKLPLAIDTFAFNEELGALLPIYQDGETYNMARISSIKNLPDSVQGRHIILAPENIGKIDSLVNALKNGADFANLAREFSVDGSSQDGGNLGWFTFSNMVRPFSDSAFFGKDKFMKVRTQFGEHILQVVDRGAESKHVQIAQIQVAITPGRTTSQGIFNKANAIAAQSNNEQNKFMELAAESGYFVEPQVSIALNDKSLGNFKNAREVVRWAYQADIGDISDVYEIDNSHFVVATLNSVREDGIAPFEQVKSEVEMAVKKEKQASAIAEELKTAMQSSSNIDDVAGKTNLQVANVGSAISFSASYIPGIMVPEQKLVGAVTSKIAENTLAGPVKGETGVYIFTINNKTKKENTNIESEKLRLESMLSMQVYEFYNILMTKANIKDNRGNFY